MMEITIRGAGIFGLSIAWACVQRGAKVRVIDPNGPGAGASGGIIGALAPHIPENWDPKKAFQLESLLAAQGFWDSVAAAGGMPSGYARTGRIQPILDDRTMALAKARIITAKELWGDKAEWRILPSDEAGEWAPQTPVGSLIFDSLSACIHPRQALAALAGAIRARGGEIIAEGSDRGTVLWATGVADLERMSVHFDRLIGNGLKGQGALLRYDARAKPQLFADGVHVVPHDDGTVAIGATSERFFNDPKATDELLDDIIERAFTAVPILRGAPIIERWAGVRPRPKSRAPMLGPHPLHDGQFIANGGFKIGFGMAPKIAEIMANLMIEGRDEIPEAFHIHASF